jgi:hypothetical protein
MCDYDYHLEINFDIFYHVYAHHHHVKKPQAQKNWKPKPRKTRMQLNTNIKIFKPITTQLCQKKSKCGKSAWRTSLLIQLLQLHFLATLNPTLNTK